MTNRSYYIFSVAALLFFAAPALQAQVTVSAKADRSQILIGEPIRLTLEAAIPEDQPIRFFTIDYFPHFEVLRKEKIDTSNTSSGTVLSQQIDITSFDSGHWIIPRFVLDGGIATDSIRIEVGFSPFDTAQPYHDIKDIIEVKPEEKQKKMRWWYIVAGALLVIIVLGLVTRKKKPPVMVAGTPHAYETALRRLEKLEQAPRDPRQYYSELVDIFREYIYHKKGIQSQQKTTEGLIMQLRDAGMPNEQSGPLFQALRLSDFVKFARYIPGPEDDHLAFTTIKNSITAIEQQR